jgi:hypothetical protein
MLEVEMKMTQIKKDADALLEIFRKHNLQHSAHAMSAICDLIGYVKGKFHPEHEEKNEVPRQTHERRRGGGKSVQRD